MNAEQFNIDYLNNIDNIITYRDLYSGTHPIDPDRSKEWIEAQLTPNRKRIAKLFIKHTKYFTFNQVFEYLRNAITKFYSYISVSEPIYMFIGWEKDSSTYTMSIIALYLIRLMKLREPTVVAVGDQIPLNGTIVIFDDCIYSGGQSVLWYKHLYNAGVRNTVYVCSAVITQLALDRKQRDYYTGWIIDIPITNLIFLSGHIVDILFFDGITVEDYFDMRYYFAPSQDDLSPSAIIYFDHKIADRSSTFQMALLTGPVPPLDIGYGYNNRFVDIIWGELKQYIHPRDYTNFKNKLYLRFDQLMGQEYKLDENVVKYIPFIKGCEDKTFPIIPYSALQSIKRDKYPDELKEIEDKGKRCPPSFYKSLY